MRFEPDGGDVFRMNTATFDLNARLEFILLSILPSALFIFIAACRLWLKARQPTVVYAPAAQVVKCGALVLHAGIVLAVCILGTQLSTNNATLLVVAASLKFATSLFMIAVSLLDHSKSPRPSVLLCGFLALTLLFDATQTRTLFMASEARLDFVYCNVFASTLALKSAILLFESYPKSSWLSWDRKEYSPEEVSGVFSIGVFFWLNRLFLRGYNKVLAIVDLYPLDGALNSEKLHERFVANFDRTRLKTGQRPLINALVWTLTVPLLLPIIPRLALVGFTLCQPLFIERLLEHLSLPTMEANIAYGFIGASFFIYSGMALSLASCWYLHNRTRIMVRSILVAEVFQKSTTIRLGAVKNNAAVTLMSSDMERIDVGIRPLHDIWASLIQVALASWMLHNKLGITFLIPMGLVTLCFVILAFLMRFAGDSQRAWMAQVQRRVGLTAIVIPGMKNLKMSGLSSIVGTYIERFRVEELEVGSRFRKITIIAALLGYIPLLLGPPLTFASAQRSLNPTRIFTSLSYLFLLTNPLSQVFHFIPQLSAAVACLGRIEAFLAADDRDDSRTISAKGVGEKQLQLPSEDASSKYTIAIQNGSFAWEEDRTVLNNINTRIPKSSLTVVVGSVGSGKSTLCKALLGEIPYSKGSISLDAHHHRTGFCDQVAFLFIGTIKENIIGFLPFDKERYISVIQATTLNVDFKTLPLGDDTNVGSDGITLSGGQKQRISLARTLYLNSDLLVLDDIFSGLDAGTEEKIFRRVFGANGLLKRRGTTVVLCTHSAKHLIASDYILALQSGTIIEQGVFAQLVAQEGYVYQLRLKATKDDCSSGTAASEDATTDMEPESIPQLSVLKSIQDETSSSRQSGDKAVYKHYIVSMGILVSLASVLLAVLWGFFTNFPTVWLKYWSEDVMLKVHTRSFGYYAGVYGLLQSCAIISLLLLGVTIFIVSVKRVGVYLHHEALDTLIHAPLSFFTSTDTGIVTNLFSQDLNLIDSELPMALLSTLICTTQALGQAAVMLTSSVYLAISYPFLALFMYFLQKFYLRTSRQLRLLDLEAKSPLYTHFLDTIKGIATLRAFGFLSDEKAKNFRLVNTSQRPVYLLLMSQQWLNFVLDVVVMILAVMLTTLAVELRSNSAFTGASLVTLMTFGETLSGIVIFYTRLETSLGAISRLKAFNETVDSEDKADESIAPPKQWPQHGVVEIDGISASYCECTEGEPMPKLALDNIQLRITSGEKVAVCGRTGSGKSSLMSFLLKLLDPIPNTAATATIDGIALANIKRSALRQHILAVPQEAVFLPDGSTFMANLDPFEDFGLADCESALRAVTLWDFVDERGGLESDMNASTLSAGQKQLMSLARIILKRWARARTSPESSGTDSGVLLLDEVSSSVDRETERLMQNIVKEEFKGYTVIAVSHRLDTIMDFDKVVVMDQGAIVEVGNPIVLAEMEGSKFGDLVKAAES